MAPGVFGKTFKKLCNLNGIYVSKNSTCRIITLDELLHPVRSTTEKNTFIPMTSISAPLSKTTSLPILYSSDTDYKSDLTSFQSPIIKSENSFIILNDTSTDSPSNTALFLITRNSISFRTNSNQYRY
eukprot:NODE_573_length_5876_cov_0.470833.p5 type:complete len:128 gc:universal NODE_573_length_5876_cov_0.470833:951-1334(+)